MFGGSCSQLRVGEVASRTVESGLGDSKQDMGLIGRTA